MFSYFTATKGRAVISIAVKRIKCLNLNIEEKKKIFSCFQGMALDLESKKITKGNVQDFGLCSVFTLLCSKFQEHPKNIRR